MNIGYSAKMNAFFLLDEEEAYRESGAWQNDILPVPDDIWMRFIGEPPQGKQRGPGEDGLPAWIDIPDQEGPTIEENESIKNALLERADTEIRMLTVVQEIYGLNEEEKQKLIAWKKYLAEVYRLNARVNKKLDWPNMPETG